MRFWLVIVTAMTVFLGCITSCSKRNRAIATDMGKYLTHRTVRIPLTSWSEDRCEPARISYERPLEAEVICSRKSVVVRFHRLPPPVGVLDDVTYGIQVTMSRCKYPRADTNDEQRNNILFHRTDGVEKWMRTRHDILARMEEDDYSYYRRDARCGQDEELTCSGHLWRRVTENTAQFATADDQAVKRIMASAKCRP